MPIKINLYGDFRNIYFESVWKQGKTKESDFTEQKRPLKYVQYGDSSGNKNFPNFN